MKRIAARREIQLTAVGLVLAALLGYLVYYRSLAPREPQQNFLGEAASQRISPESDSTPELQ